VRTTRTTSIAVRSASSIIALLVLSLIASVIPRAIAHEGQQAPSTTQRRPKIGLALSGGGARGFAHVGVLEWFEQHRIPVDYIAGTSMGGLIGAMYAIGKSPAELRKIVTTLDWDVLLRGYPSFQQLSYRRKEDRLNIPGPITLGFKNGASLPAGINAGMEVGLIFEKYAMPYDLVSNFDDLPIPFRCVATDLAKGESVVLKSGSLSRSLRATMSIPGLFTPVELDGHLLADGAVMNNIPTDVVKEMGADIVIAVDIGTPLGDKDSIGGLFSVISQTTSVATIENVRRNIRLADLLISPDLEKYSLMDFADANAIADLGFKGAEQKALLLDKFALSEPEWQQHLAARRAKLRTELPTPSFVKVEGGDKRTTAQIEEALSEIDGKPIDHHELEEGLRKVWGTGRLESLDYQWIREGGKDGLLIRTVDKSYGPPFLDVGFVVNNSATDDTEVNLLGRLTFYDLGRNNAEWRTDFSLGTRVAIGTEYFRPIGNSGFFVAPHASYDTQQRNIFGFDEKLAEYKLKTASAGIDVGYTLTERSQMRLGYSIGHQKANRVVGVPFFPEISGTQSVSTFTWNYLGQNSPQFPTRGLWVKSNASYYFKSPGSTAGFPQGEIRAAYGYKLNEKNTLTFAGSGGTTFGHDASPFQKFTLGGLFRLGGYGRGEFLGNHYVLGEVGYMRRIHRLPSFLGGSVFAGAWYDGGSAFDERSRATYNMSGTGGLLVETRLGPIFIGGSWAEGGRGKFYFSLGRLFF